MSQTPSYQERVLWREGVYQVKIQVRRGLPVSCINCDPTNEYFYFDTLKDSKKYVLKYAYPKNINVDLTNVAAELNGTTLIVQMPFSKKVDDGNTRATVEGEKKKRKKNTVTAIAEATTKIDDDGVKKAKKEVSASDDPKKEKKNEKKRKLLASQSFMMDMLEVVNKKEDERTQMDHDRSHKKAKWLRERKEARKAKKKLQQQRVDAVVVQAEREKMERDKYKSDKKSKKKKKKKKHENVE